MAMNNNSSSSSSRYLLDLVSDTDTGSEEESSTSDISRSTNEISNDTITRISRKLKPFDSAPSKSRLDRESLIETHLGESWNLLEEKEIESNEANRNGGSKSSQQSSNSKEDLEKEHFESDIEYDYADSDLDSSDNDSDSDNRDKYKDNLVIKTPKRSSEDLSDSYSDIEIIDSSTPDIINLTPDIKNNTKTKRKYSDITNAEDEEIFKSIGKKKAVRRYFSPDDISIKCYNCGEVGHIQLECPKPRLLKPCFLCGLRTHQSYHCTEELCHKCHTKGHQARDCTSARFIARVCMRCGSTSHYFDHCTTPPSSGYWDLSNIRCFKCGKKGHLNCSAARLSKPIVQCCNCAGNDHIYTQCDQPTMPIHVIPDTYSGFNSSSPINESYGLCFVCNERGHQARQCPNRHRKRNDRNHEGREGRGRSRSRSFERFEEPYTTRNKKTRSRSSSTSHTIRKDHHGVREVERRVWLNEDKRVGRMSNEFRDERKRNKRVRLSADHQRQEEREHEKRKDKDFDMSNKSEHQDVEVQSKREKKRFPTDKEKVKLSISSSFQSRRHSAPVDVNRKSNKRKRK